MVFLTRLIVFLCFCVHVQTWDLMLFKTNCTGNHPNHFNINIFNLCLSYFAGCTLMTSVDILWMYQCVGLWISQYSVLSRPGRRLSYIQVGHLLYWPEDALTSKILSSKTHRSVWEIIVNYGGLYVFTFRVSPVSQSHTMLHLLRNGWELNNFLWDETW